ncbi:MAG: FkbM family methyltransferase [Chthoniobacteraceae bacterium]
MKTAFAKLCRPLFERVVFTRRLPADLGGAGIYVSPRIDARVLRQSISEMDPDLLAAARLLVRPGKNVWDIGSNLGVFTMAATHLTGPAGTVLAVDADAAHVEMLRRTVRRAGHSTVTPLHCGIAASVGVARLNIVGRGKAKNFMAEAESAAAVGEVVEQHTVVTVTLDWLSAQFPAPDVVKIDIEGAELMALQGATTLLEKVRPAIYIEVQGKNVSGANSLLRSLRYSLFEIAATGPALAPLETCAFNTVALPEERVDEFRSSNAQRSQ